MNSFISQEIASLTSEKNDEISVNSFPGDPPPPAPPPPPSPSPPIYHNTTTTAPKSSASHASTSHQNAKNHMIAQTNISIHLPQPPPQKIATKSMVGETRLAQIASSQIFPLVAGTTSSFIGTTDRNPSLHDFIARSLRNLHHELSLDAWVRVFSPTKFNGSICLPKIMGYWGTPFLCTDPIEYKCVKFSNSDHKDSGKTTFKSQLINQQADFSYVLSTGELAFIINGNYEFVLIINSSIFSRVGIGVFGTQLSWIAAHKVFDDENCAESRLIKDFFWVFEIMDEKNELTWISPMAGCCQNELYICLFSACKHMRLFEKGRKYSARMSKEHDLSPDASVGILIICRIGSVVRCDNGTCFTHSRNWFGKLRCKLGVRIVDQSNEVKVREVDNIFLEIMEGKEDHNFVGRFKEEFEDEEELEWSLEPEIGNAL